ncbi:MAG TPA: NifU family protein [Longimicrobiales bacterium]|nr:NifU family protein [Longimicrobiales bacterium]
MLTFTDSAREKVFGFIEQGFVEDAALRISVGGSPLAPQYDIELVEYEERAEDDRVFTAGGFKLLVDPQSADRLEGATVDFVERNGASGFEVRPPQPKERIFETGSLSERVKRVIDSEVNPAIASHGGHIVLLEVRDDIAYVEMSGGCQGCGMARVTLSQGVERMIKQAVPEIMGVKDVTDHDAGATPYFAK